MTEHVYLHKSPKVLVLISITYDGRHYWLPFDVSHVIDSVYQMVVAYQTNVTLSANQKTKAISTNSLVNKYESSFVTRGFNAFAESIDSRQPEQSAQADMGRNFPPSFF